MASPRFIILLFLPVLILPASCSNNPGKGNADTDVNSSYIENESTIYGKGDSLLFHKGEVLFKKDCNSCHVAKYKLHNYLEGVVDWLGTNYLRLYLTKQDSLMTAKDSIALRLKEVWGNRGNNHNFHYSEDDLNAIVEYLR